MASCVAEAGRVEVAAHPVGETVTLNSTQGGHPGGVALRRSALPATARHVEQRIATLQTAGKEHGGSQAGKVLVPALGGGFSLTASSWRAMMSRARAT